MSIGYNDNRDYLVITGPSGWTGATSMTVAAWLYPTSLTEDMVIQSEGNISFTLGWWNDTDGLEWYVEATTGTQPYATAQFGTDWYGSANEWKFFAAVMDNLVPKIYYAIGGNPVQEVSYQTQTTGSGTMPLNGTTIYLCQRDNNDSRRLNGYLAYYWFYYGQALSLGQLRHLQYHPGSHFSPSLFLIPGFHGLSSVPDLSGNNISVTIGDFAMTLEDHAPLGPPFGFDEGRAYSAVAVGSYDVDFSINSVMAVTMAADAVAEGALSLAKSLGISVNGDAVGEAAMSIALNKSIIVAGDVTAEAALALSMALGISAQADATGEGLITLAKSLGLSKSADAQGDGSFTLNKSLGLSKSGDAQADASLTIAAYLALAFVGQEAGVQDVFVDFPINSIMGVSMSASAQAEAAFNAAHQMALQLGGISDAAAAISTGIQSGISASARMDMQAAVSLAKSFGLSSAADSTAFGSLSLNHIMAIATVAQALADAGISINAVQSIEVVGTQVIFGLLTPDGRTVVVSAETRTMVIETEDRTVNVPSEDRTLKVT